MDRAPDQPLVTAGADHDADEVLLRLSQIDILRALPPEEVQELVPRVAQMNIPAGHCLMQQGAAGDALYLIESGTARVERTGSKEVIRVGAGSVVGEAALLTGEPRSATVTADTALSVWRVSKEAFDRIVAASPNLRQALEALVEQRRSGVPVKIPSRAFWVSTGLRALEARYRGLHLWEQLMGIGLALWVALFLNEHWTLVDEEKHQAWFAALQLLTGLLVIQGACEAFLHGVERLGARQRWEGFISGTVGSVLSTLPEFVVIAFLVLVDPLAAFVTAAVTIYNNALAFSIYSFFLPKDRQGAFTMPRSLTIAGGEILIAGGAVTLIVGAIMLMLRIDGTKLALAGADLLVIGVILIAIYGYYLLTLVRYYGEGRDNEESQPPDPGRLGHDTSWSAIVSMFALGLIGSYCGGEAIGAFAETALKGLGMPTIPTAAALAFFAGISEYIIVYKSHRRGELGIALSNVFGGLTQVLFLLLPFGLLVIGIGGLGTGDAKFAIPVNMATIMLMLLLFPLFYALHQYIEQDKTLSNLDAAGMTGIYVLLLYFLFTSPT
jgi:CRP-like cAMP-binding protein